MGKVTGIEWCDHTYNPWIGCTKVSPVTTATRKLSKTRDIAVWRGAAHVGPPALPHAVRHTIGIDKQRRPVNVVVYFACRWAIAGTTNFPMSGVLRR